MTGAAVAGLASIEGEEEQMHLCSASTCLFGACDWADGVATDPKNIAAIQRWATPSNVKEVRGFLGLDTSQTYL
jgi:hypothetical protein